MKLRTMASGLLIAMLFYVGGAAMDIFLFGREFRPTSNLGMTLVGFWAGIREDRRAAPAQPSPMPAA